MCVCVCVCVCVHVCVFKFVKVPVLDHFLSQCDPKHCVKCVDSEVCIVAKSLCCYGYCLYCALTM